MAQWTPQLLVEERRQVNSIEKSISLSASGPRRDRIHETRTQPVGAPARRELPLFRAASIALVLLLGSVGTSQAFVTVFDHSGNTDPLTEGWSGNGGGPVANDAGSGFDAWVIDDDSTTGSSAGYFQVPLDSQISQASSLGWRLSARIRLVDIPDMPGGSPALIYRDDAKTWQIHFGTEADGDPKLDLVTAVVGTLPTGFTSFTLQGGGSGYHLYELVFDPVLGSADLFIDGVEQVSNYVGATFGSGFPLPKSVFWGAASTTDIGQGNYNQARFEIVSASVPTLSAWGLAIAAAAISVVGVALARIRRVGC